MWYFGTTYQSTQIYLWLLDAKCRIIMFFFLSCMNMWAYKKSLAIIFPAAIGTLISLNISDILWKRISSCLVMDMITWHLQFLWKQTQYMATGTELHGLPPSSSDLTQLSMRHSKQLSLKSLSSYKVWICRALSAQSAFKNWDLRLLIPVFLF